MNTTAAAAEAQVTVATIRTWCRRGVIAAAKTAGRWVIDTVSLARRIAIGAMRTRKATPVIDLNGVTVKRRTVRRTGANTTVLSNLAPLFTDRFNAIPDDGDRAHALNVFASAVIVISDQADGDWAGDPQAREDGRLRTSYRGDVPGISVADVLDIAVQIRAQEA